MVVKRIQSSQVLEAVSTFNFIAAGAPPENIIPIEEAGFKYEELNAPDIIDILLPKTELGDELSGKYSVGCNAFLVGFPEWNRTV